MTLENVKKFRDEIAKNRPFIVVCDNEHIFYTNVEDSIPIAWDDDTESFTVIRPNTNLFAHATQELCPMLVETTEYEHIQFMQVLLTTAEALEVLEKYKDKFGENADKKYEYAKAIIAQSANNRMAKGPYNY